MSTESTPECQEFRTSVTEYLEQELSPARRLSAEQHLSSCWSCTEFLRQICLTIEALRRLGNEPLVDEPKDTELKIYREWWRDHRKRAPLSQKNPENFVEEIVELPKEQWDKALRGSQETRSREFLELTLAKALQMGFRDPARAVVLGELGVAVCLERLRVDETQRSRAYDDLGRAYGVLGNAKRICSDFLGASEAFQQAAKSLERGCRDGSGRAQLLQLRARFLADCGRHEKALKEMDEAIGIFKFQEDSHQVGRALISKGSILGPVGDPEAAVDLLREGLSMIDRELEPRLALVAKHNLIHYLAESGRLREAITLIPETRVLHLRFSNAVDLARFRWLEGQIALELDDLHTAENAFLEVRQFFAEREISFDTALVSLDLARLFHRKNEIPQLKIVASEMVAIFRALGIQREALAALAFFNKALEVEKTATLSLLKELGELLEQTRSNEDFGAHLSVSS